MPDPSMRDMAELRGKRAQKLFTKIDEADFNKILEAITMEEKHKMDPITNWQSGKQQFYDICWKAVVKDKSQITDPSHNMTDPELAAFIDDLWNATWGSRQSQEVRPCW